MLASFIGVRVSQVKLVGSANIDKKIAKYGSNIGDLAKATKKAIPQGVFWYKEKTSVIDIDRIVNKYKFPVGVEWQGVFREDTDKNFPDDGHYSVITYFNRKENKLCIADPFRDFAKEDRNFKIDYFKKRWWDFNEIKNLKTKKMKQVKDTRMMFVITPKDETFPKEIGMKRI